MESFQPGLSFSLCDEAGIILRLVYMARSGRAELNIQVYIQARMKSQPGRNNEV